jgi:hypothetical protein
MLKCNRYLQGVYCASVHSIQSHCSYPGCSGRADQKPCSAHKSSSNLVRSSSFIDCIRSRAAPPPLPCSPDIVGPSYAGAGSVTVAALVAQMVGAAVIVFPFLGHCFDMCPCARQLKHWCSLSSVFCSSLVRNVAQLFCPRDCWNPLLLVPVVSTASTSIASSFRRQLFPLLFNACSHLFLLCRRNGLANVALFSAYAV